ncbi:OsmC family protein [Brevibacillus choshinensis]|uniref:OsmC family protein n=1 Tax=Brevibacillus choshinensis TaxID=54911 RepID=A0ABX7FMB2_BRECH|nr:OsmC family protein [Brevibacillus choshinensis]QRG66990.1 OsmC family protein [Brevibacillus choshinensis]
MTATAKKQMNVQAQWKGKLQFEAKGPSGYPVFMDSSVALGGEGAGNSPLELILVGLVGCMGIGVTKLLEKMRQSPTAIEIVADGIRDEAVPHAITEIHLTFHVSGEVAPSRIWQAVKLESEQYCPVAASLKATIIPHVFINGNEVAESEGTVEEE